MATTPLGPRPEPTTHRRAARRRPETFDPGERARLAPRRLAAAYVAAVVLPLACAVAMIPFRATHLPAVTVFMVVPVVLVATLGATGPALVAALSAGTSFAVLLTEPYYHPTVNNADDVAAVAILAAVSLIVGLVNSRLVRTSARASTRQEELQHLIRFATTASGPAQPAAITAEACAHLDTILGLRGSAWHPGPHPGAGPVLLPTGGIAGLLTDLNADRATLPAHLEVPATAGGVEIGHFVLQPDPNRVVSYEQRLTAATIAALCAGALDTALR